jgi:SAM-dependent methyltransferase
VISPPSEKRGKAATRGRFLGRLSARIQEFGIHDGKLRFALGGAIQSMRSRRIRRDPQRRDLETVTHGEPVRKSRPTKPMPAHLEEGMVDFGDLRRLEPVSRVWGFDRGRPIDRYYIERFLEARSTAIRGRVLEIGEPLYTEMFGGGRVTQSEVLDVMGNPDATFTCRLEEGDELPAGSFDCIVVTQTLQYIYDFRAALRTLYRILKSGGTLLATVPGITRISQEEYKDAWYWSFTGASITGLFNELFARDALEVEVFGNILSATGFLYGLAESELASEELDHFDPNYQVIVAVHAVK